MTDPPNPDPTRAMIDALRREISMAKEQTDLKVGKVEALMERAERQRVEQKADTRTAIDAALEAQEKAAAKMEKAVADQIGSLQDNFDTEVRSIRSTLADLKERLTTLESVRRGAAVQRVERRHVSAGVAAVAGVAVTVVIAVVAVLALVA